MILRIFIFLQALVFGQKCINLKGSRNCPGLENYSILPSEEFNSLATLDSYLDSGNFTNNGFIQGFRQKFQWYNLLVSVLTSVSSPKFEGFGGRYVTSTYCAYVSQSSSYIFLQLLDSSFQCQLLTANRNILLRMSSL